MFCTVCGKQIETEPSMFCNHCGSRTQAPVQQSRSTKASTRNGPVPRWLWVIGIFAGFILINALLNKTRPHSQRADISSPQQAQTEFPDPTSDSASHEAERVESGSGTSDSILSRDPAQMDYSEAAEWAKAAAERHSVEYKEQCENAIKGKLQHPSTADFDYLTGEGVGAIGRNIQVVVYFSAQNSFGLRLKFKGACTIWPASREVEANIYEQ